MCTPRHVQACYSLAGLPPPHPLAALVAGRSTAEHPRLSTVQPHPILMDRTPLIQYSTPISRYDLQAVCDINSLCANTASPNNVCYDAGSGTPWAPCPTDLACIPDSTNSAGTASAQSYCRVSMCGGVAGGQQAEASQGTVQPPRAQPEVGFVL